ncbi:C-type lectin domain family 4 member M-like [Astyanax mexicanus]|uniref:C-type lectin domain family 4 member M-like n=1 Tax=Astyanax mexicanus TaxID=7994 RepID=A0A8T2KQI5_ASTMX|nr:C-type lectin domain family 4 member M-like [Astyanax mexicanus]
MQEGIHDDLDSDDLSEMDSDVMTTVIYTSKDGDYSAQDTDTERETRRQHRVVRRGSRCSRLAAGCFGLLCVLLLITNILLYMYYKNENETEDRTMAKISYQNLTEERDQLKEILSKEHRILQDISPDLVKLLGERNMQVQAHHISINILNSGNTLKILMASCYLMLQKTLLDTLTNTGVGQ